MRPCKLKITGFNSFIDEQVIDFTKLTERGLFGIIGPTGSGKSTILDAITMALYGKISRNSKEYINSECNSMQVSFEFQIRGASTNTYVAERSVKKKKNGDYGTPSARLIEIVGNDCNIIEEGVSKVASAIEQIIGLNYDDFSRSVVLPQGKFSEFLTLSGTLRRNMLERIFGLEIYGQYLTKKILKEKNEQMSKLRDIISKLEVYTDITPELLSELKNNAEISNNAIINNKNVLEQKSKQLETKKQKFNIQKELSKYKKLFDSLEKNKPLIETKRLKLTDAQKTNNIFPLIQELEEATLSIKQNKLKLNQFNENYSDVIEKERKTIKEYDNAVEMKNTQYPILLEKETKLKEALKMENELLSEKKELENIRSSFKSARDAVEKGKASEKLLNSERETIIIRLTVIEKRKEEITISLEERDKLQDNYYIENKYNELKSEFDSYLNNIHKEKTSIKSELDLKHKEQKNTENKINNNTQKLESSTEKLENLKTQIKQIEINNMASVLAESLNENSPCPVCGSTHHPNTANNIDHIILNDYYENENKTIKEIEKLNKALNTLSITQATISKDIQQLELNYSRLTPENFNKLQEFNELEKTFINLKKQWNLESFEPVLNRLKKLDKERITLEREEKKIRVTLSEYDSKKEQIQKNISNAQLNYDTLLIRGREKAETLKKQEEKISELSEGKDPKLYLKQTQAEKNAIDKKEKSLKITLEDIQKQRQTIENNKIKAEQQKESLEQLYTNQDTKLNLLLKENDINSKQDCKQMYLPISTQKTLETEIKEFENELANVVSNIKRLERDLSEELTTESEIKTLIREIEKLNNDIEMDTKKLAVYTERIKNMEADLKEIAKLKKAEQQLSKKCAMLEDISKLVEGNKFVEFIAKSRLKYITKEASQRLMEITRERYALELDGVDFIMRDNLNGGIRRAPNTLSGGEVFLTSLALALALSSKIQLKNNAPLEFFFLDEGFGTLDSGLIDIAMNSLERLHTANVSVGLITHVDELKNRLPIKLIVKPQKQGISGTKVKIE